MHKLNFYYMGGFSGGWRGGFRGLQSHSAIDVLSQADALINIAKKSLVVVVVMFYINKL